MAEEVGSFPKHGRPYVRCSILALIKWQAVERKRWVSVSQDVLYNYRLPGSIIRRSFTSSYVTNYSCLTL